jgi:4,5-dihydroxyphthalate decarboxylase
MPTLKVAFHVNPRIRPLVDGAVRIDGYDCDWTVGHASELHARHLNENAFDVFEFSISNLFITRDKPERSHLRWLAIPMFLLKADPFLAVFAHRDAGVRTFADLKGKTFGMPDYQMTAALWMRIVLREMYGITPQDMAWVNGRTPSQTHGQGVAENLAPGIELRRLPEGQKLNDLLQRGEVQAAFGDGAACSVGAGPNVDEVPPEVGWHLFADYRAKTGTTPVNHVLLVQEHMVKADPDLPMKLYDAFERSKLEAYRRAREEAAGLLLFPDQAFRQNAAAYGDDPYPAGFKANRRMLESVVDQLVSEQLISKRPAVESIFAPSTLST